VYCNNPGGRCTWADMADNFYLSARVYQLALTQELLGTTADGWHRFSGGGRVHASHTAARGRGAQVPQPSSWPFGGDAIPIVDGKGGALLPLVEPGGDALSPLVLHAYQRSAGAPPDPTCPLFTPAAAAGADNTAVGDYGDAGIWFALPASLSAPAAAAACNASCWANATCAAWDLIKVTPSSGKTQPTCGLFGPGVAAGCTRDPNQWAGAKAPLPIPAPAATLQQTWTLPLAWVGRALTAVSLTPQGEAPAQVRAEGRTLLVNVTPAYAVRISASG